MDRIDRIKEEMMKAECGMMNERQAASYLSFILPSSFYPAYPVHPVNSRHTLSSQASSLD
jgi:hypothetical protein